MSWSQIQGAYEETGWRHFQNKFICIFVFAEYWDGHFEEIGTHFRLSINLFHDLRYNVIMLNELEGHLIRLQERIEYFNIKNDKKNLALHK